VRVLAFADEAPPADAAELVAQNHPDLIVTLGDLEAGCLAPLARLDLPRLGVLGNHDEYELETVGVGNVHLSGAEVGGWSFSGFEGCVRYDDGPHQYTQEEADELIRRLPAADVLLCHCPPWGVNDEPSDHAHVGFRALREWVELHSPRHLLHGHTTPDPRTQTHRVGETEVHWIRGVALLELE
jgi:Icc-related predicted phosphoesterase